MHLTQTGLIDQIIAATNLDEKSAKKFVPAIKALSSDKQGTADTGEFNYRSVVGMMMYLANNTRPDISFAVNQCTRYGNKPMILHEKAIKYISRYLLGTRTEGMYVQLSNKLTLDCFVDADFAGLWNVENKDDPVCVRSRTGFVIHLGEVPLIWVSKLQSKIASSTMMAEYIALSTVMRTLIPLRTTVAEVMMTMNHDFDSKSIIKSTIWEDNTPALTLANAEPPRLTPGSKHFAVKYHWFRQHLKKGEIEIQSIASSAQAANVLTKAMPRNNFETIR
jgi:hypothetical protein